MTKFQSNPNVCNCVYCRGEGQPDLVDLLVELSHTCGELTCDECNRQRQAAAREIAKLRKKLNEQRTTN